MTPPEHSSVLIVDDDEQIRDTLRFLLEDAGYAVQEAENGLRALDALAASDAPLIVLLDNFMPHLDGATLLRRIEGDARLADRHRFLMITASPQALTTETRALLTRNAIPIIRKPFDIDTLLGAITSTTPMQP